MDDARNLGIVPLLYPGVATVVQGAKLPAGLKDDHARRKGESRIAGQQNSKKNEQGCKE